jgi:hypothetical protein
MAVHGSGRTGRQTGCFIAVAALEGKREIILLLYQDSGKGTGKFLLERLKNLLGFGMLDQTMYLT